MDRAVVIDRVLAIDTAGPVIGVGLWDGARADIRTERIARGAEGRLLVWADELCAAAGWSRGDIEGIGVAAGPGAFTGLRVGLATASGLAQALDVPLWLGSSLESRAARVAAGSPVLAMLDARKGRVYALALDAEGGVLHGPGDVPPEEAVGWGGEGVVATGEGAIVYADLVRAGGCRLANEPDHPAVDTLARLTAEGLARGEGIAASQVEPVYLRAPDAKPSNKGRI